jgi:transcriptional regulator with GAF, ATPase, and Fis domain
MRKTLDLVRQVAPSTATVLIQGESGTGKEVIAGALHQGSPRRERPLVKVSCAALPETLLESELFGHERGAFTGAAARKEGRFELADGGTLFLDEVADLTAAAQAKLLRAIQELSVERVGGHSHRRVDARIVVATNRSLRQLVARGLFREDLYYRLSGVELVVPPLRARREDIPALAAHFLAHHSSARPLALNTEALHALTTYEWPGNVRELERTLEGAVTAARSDVIRLEDLPAPVRNDFEEIVWPSLSRGDTLRAWGCRYAQLVLERCDGNKRRACDVLGISYHTLQSYLRDPRRDGLERDVVGDDTSVETPGRSPDADKAHNAAAPASASAWPAPSAAPVSQ